MKIVILLFLSFLSQGQNSAVGEDVTKTFKEKSKLMESLQNYTNAFEAKNFKILKSTVTENFITVTGGEQVWKERFKKLKNEKKKNTKIKNLKIVLRDNKIYVRFDTYEKMPQGNWFAIQKVNNGFLLDEPINDFDPE